MSSLPQMSDPTTKQKRKRVLALHLGAITDNECAIL